MSDMMMSAGLDITDFKNSLNQLNESSQKMAAGVKGNMLALGAGVLGVGAIVYTFAKQSTDEFDNLMDSSRALSAEFAKLSSASGFDALNSALSESVKKADELAVAEAKSALARKSIVRGYAQGFALLLQGKGLGEAEVEIQKEISRQYWERIKLIDKVKQSSQQELAMSEMRLHGTKDEIEELERKIKLERESAAIIASSFDAGTKAILLANAEKKKQAEDGKAQIEFEKKQAAEFHEHQKKDGEERAAKAKKLGEEKAKASEEMQQAQDALNDSAKRYSTLKEKAAAQSQKVADAEFRLRTAAKGTVEEYTRQKELAEERLRLENLIAERAGAYAGGTAKGRKFDREEKKKEREQERGRKRLDAQIERENKRGGVQQPRPGAPGGVAPRPIMQPNAPAAPGGAAATPAAGQVMQVATLIVGTLKSK